MAVEQPDFTALDETVGVFEVDLAVSRRFDLGPGQNDPCLKPLENLIVVKGLTVYRNVMTHRTVPGVAPSVPGPAGCAGAGPGVTGKPAEG